MRKMFIRETALVLAAAVLTAGALASCRTDVSDGDIPYSPYLKIEKRNGVDTGGGYKDGVYVAYGIYEESIPADGKIVIPDGVELDWTWRNVYDKSDKWLGSLNGLKVNSISIPAGAGSMTFSNIWFWGIDIIYRGSLADWCEHGYLDSDLLNARSIKIGNGQTDPRKLERITASEIAGAKRIGERAFSGCEKLTSVEIPDSVTEIGGSAFYGSGLTAVTIGNGVTEIGDYAFYGCSGLTTVTIGKGVTKIGDDAFSSCSNLKEIAIPDSVKEIGDYAFAWCSGLMTLTIGKGVTKIGKDAFYECKKLTSVAIPDSVTEIGNQAFYNCSGLTTVTIGKGVTKIGEYAFSNCNALNSVTFAETDGWYWVNSANNEEQVDFSNPAENGSKLKNAYNTYFVRKTE